ncbi:DUF1010 domain-containing protein [Diaphorobacter sp.]
MERISAMKQFSVFLASSAHVVSASSYQFNSLRITGPRAGWRRSAGR